MSDLRLAHRVLAEFFAEDPEPVPAWEEGDEAKLQTICECTEVGVFGVEKYPDLYWKAGKLFYSTIKMHAFPNGNKRFALVLTLLLFSKNDQRLTTPVGVNTATATDIAASDPQTRRGNPDAYITVLADHFRENSEPRLDSN
jgi:death-on-curing family protein